MLSRSLGHQEVHVLLVDFSSTPMSGIIVFRDGNGGKIDLWNITNNISGGCSNMVRPLWGDGEFVSKDGTSGNYASVLNAFSDRHHLVILVRNLCFILDCT